jgi:large subunit ribosomal protein L46
LVKRESLHQAAERILVQAAGVNMNTWVVGNAPIGHEEHNHRVPVTEEDGRTQLGVKTFFMKARIMAGQADLSKSALGFKDFRWLAKEELPSVLSTRHFSIVRNMLADR